MSYKKEKNKLWLWIVSFVFTVCLISWPVWSAYVPESDFIKSLRTLASEAAFKTFVNLEIGVDVEAYDAATAKTDEAETITENWVNTAYPWADNEVANDITLTNLTQITNRKIDDLGTPDDNTDLNATSTYHGLLPKLSDNSSQFLNGQGGWSVPAGGGDVAKVGTPSNHQWGIWTGDGTLEGVTVTGSKVVCTDADGEPIACTNLTDLAFSSYATIESINTASELETVANLGAYASDILAATSEANFKSITNLEAGTDFTLLAATHDTAAELDALYEAELNDSAGLLAALDDETGTGVAVFNISPTFTGTMIAENIDGSGTISANLFTPDAADGAALGTVDLELSDLFLADGGIIYGQNDQSNTLTSSATGWTANLGFIGDLTGNVTGNTSGSSGSCTGNSATATLAATVTYADNENTAETNAVVFLPGGDLDGGNLAPEVDGDFHYNPSTGMVTATGFTGALTGNATTSSHASDLSIANEASGDVLYFDGSNWTRLAADAGKYLKSGTPPTWDTLAGSGDVTSVGDCTDGACLDGSADGGTYIAIYDGNSHKLTLGMADLTGDLAVDIPAALTTTNFGYITGLTSDAQTQLDARCLESVFGTSLEADDLVNTGGVLTLQAEIPHSDAAIDISGNWEVQDGVHFSFGNDDDASWAWDAATARLELRNVSDTPIFWFDLANSSFNVKAIASPQNSLYDSDAAGSARADEYAGGIGSNMTDTTEDAEVSDLDLYYMNAGTKTSALKVDGSQNAMVANIPVRLDDNSSVSIEGGADQMDDHEYNGVLVEGLDCGENVGLFQTVFINNDTDPIHLADATAASGEYPAFGIAVAAATDTNPVKILVRGIIRDETWTGLTPGTAIYLGESDGAIITNGTAPSTANDCVQIIGWAISDSEIYFDFSRPYQLVE